MSAFFSFFPARPRRHRQKVPRSESVLLRRRSDGHSRGATHLHFRQHPDQDVWTGRSERLSVEFHCSYTYCVPIRAELPTSSTSSLSLAQLPRMLADRKLSSRKAPSPSKPLRVSRRFFTPPSATIQDYLSK